MPPGRSTRRISSERPAVIGEKFEDAQADDMVHGLGWKWQLVDIGLAEMHLAVTLKTSMRKLQHSGRQIDSHHRKPQSPEIYNLLPAAHPMSRTRPLSPASIVGSKARIDRELGRPTRHFCYPNGDVNGTVLEVVKKAGFEMAVTTRSGMNAPGEDPYLLKRLSVEPGLPDSLLPGRSGRAARALNTNTSPS